MENEKVGNLTVNLDKEAYESLKKYKDQVKEFTFLDQSGEGEPIMFKSVEVQEEKAESDSAVDHPKHYNQGKYEVIDVINDWKLNFSLGNVVKYIARAPYKSSPKEDLEKAKWYLDYALSHWDK